MTTSHEWSRLSSAEREIIIKHQSDFPIKVGAIAKDLGLIVKKSTLAAGISGEIKKVDDTYIIRINGHDVKERQRFTLAHEISHFLLHKDQIGDGIVDDVLYRSGLPALIETQANMLAADIIMPWSLIKKHLEELKALKVEERIEKLAAEAEVSTTAIKIRLGKI